MKRYQDIKADPCLPNEWKPEIHAERKRCVSNTFHIHNERFDKILCFTNLSFFSQKKNLNLEEKNTFFSHGRTFYLCANSLTKNLARQYLGKTHHCASYCVDKRLGYITTKIDIK